MHVNVEQNQFQADKQNETIYSPSMRSISSAASRLHSALNQMSDAIGIPDLEKVLNVDIAVQRRRTVRAVLKLRNIRGKHLGESIFVDPAWNILLDAYASELDGRKMSVSDACIASQSPYTTALRWLKALEDRDLLVRLGDSGDRRRYFIKLTQRAYKAMESLIDEAIRTLALPI